MINRQKILRSKSFHWIAGILILLLLLRALAPIAVEQLVNRSIKKAPGIDGQIDGVDLHIYRGAYSIQGIELVTLKNDKRYPFVTIKELDISIFWSKLLRGQVVTELIFTEPRFTFTDVKETETEQYDPVTEEETWLGISRDLVPFDIDRLEVIDGHLSFEGRSIEKEEKGDFFMSDVNGYVVGLTTKASDEKIAPGLFKARAMIYGESDAILQGSFDMFSQKPVFDLNATVNDVPAKSVDDLISVYAPFDIEAGSFRAATELKAVNGELSGYMKVGAKNLKVFSWREDVEKDGDNPIQLLFEGFLEGVAKLLTNPKSDLIATNIPIKGRLDDPDTSVFRAFLGLLHNAFIDALNVKLDNILSFDSDDSQQDSQNDSREDKAKNK